MCFCLCSHARGEHRPSPDLGCTHSDCGCCVFVAMRDARITDAPADWIRRHAMVWLLRGTGATHESIGAMIGLSSSQIARLCRSYERRIALRACQAAYWDEPWAKRLRAAGAIP